MNRRERSYFLLLANAETIFVFCYFVFHLISAPLLFFQSHLLGKKGIMQMWHRGGLVLHHLIRQHLGRFLQFLKIKSISFSFPGGTAAVNLQHNISGYRLIVLLSVICISSVLSIFLYCMIAFQFHAKYTWLAFSSFNNNTER